MSSFATAWAWDQKVRQNEKLLLLLLAESADRHGSGSNLSDLMGHAETVCGFDQQTVNKHLQSLEQSGLLDRTGRDDYRLNLGSREPDLKAFRLSVE